MRVVASDSLITKTIRVCQILADLVSQSFSLRQYRRASFRPVENLELIDELDGGVCCSVVAPFGRFHYSSAMSIGNRVMNVWRLVKH